MGGNRKARGATRGDDADDGVVADMGGDGRRGVGRLRGDKRVGDNRDGDACGVGEWDRGDDVDGPVVCAAVEEEEGGGGGGTVAVAGAEWRGREDARGSGKPNSMVGGAGGGGESTATEDVGGAECPVFDVLPEPVPPWPSGKMVPVDTRVSERGTGPGPGIGAREVTLPTVVSGSMAADEEPPPPPPPQACDKDANVVAAAVPLRDPQAFPSSVSTLVFASIETSIS